MKNTFIPVCLLIAFIVISACRQDTGESDIVHNAKKEVNLFTEVDNEIAQANTSEDRQSLSQETSPLSNMCSNLKNEYASLISQINEHKEDKNLITELIAWTKDPSHLECLETNQQYNSFIEELNGSL